MPPAHNTTDLRRHARRFLPKGVFEFIDRGSEDEVGLRNNRESFERIKIVPRTLVDVSKRTLDTSLFGSPMNLPVAIAPTGIAGLCWYQGELALARAAAEAGIPFTLATGSMTSMEVVAAEARGARLWFQLYMWPDRSMSHQLVERAKAARYEALIVTVDGVVAGNREYNLRNGFTVPFTFTRTNVLDVLGHPQWLMQVLGRYMTTTGMPKYENYPAELRTTVTAKPVGRAQPRNDSLTWDDLRVLRKMWTGPLMVKGILHPADAKQAVDCGADAVIVSNHGGRNCDSTVAPIEALPPIVDAVGTRTTVIVDSGFRRGTDVVKALALGAKCVLIGRPALYGVAMAGQAGAARAITIFRDEISRTVAQLGCTSIAQIDRSCVTDLTGRQYTSAAVHT